MVYRPLWYLKKCFKGLKAVICMKQTRMPAEHQHQSSVVQHLTALVCATTSIYKTWRTDTVQRYVHCSMAQVVLLSTWAQDTGTACWK